MGEDSWVCTEGGLTTPVWQRGGDGSRIQMHAGHSIAWNHQHSVSIPAQGSSSPRPRWGTPPHICHGPVVPKPPPAAAGSGSCCFAPSVPPLGLVSAHLLQLIETPQTEQTAPSTARLTNEAKLTPHLYGDNSDSTGAPGCPDSLTRDPQAAQLMVWGLPGGHSTAATTKSLLP